MVKVGDYVTAQNKVFLNEWHWGVVSEIDGDEMLLIVQYPKVAKKICVTSSAKLLPEDCLASKTQEFAKNIRETLSIEKEEEAIAQ